MTKPPHSGCGCESGNNLPCEHNECSYCSLLRQRQDDLLAAEDRRSKMEAKRMLMEQIKKEVEAEAARQKAAASGMDAARRAVLYGEPKSEMDETTTITRAALEGLCAQAGIEMDWNGGQPIIRKGTLVPGGSLTERAVNSLTANAVASMDTLVGKKLKETIRETLRGDLVENEATIIRKAKNDGVTDDDIGAVRKLLGWKPPDDLPPVPEPKSRKPEARRMKGKTIEYAVWDEIWRQGQGDTEQLTSVVNCTPGADGSRYRKGNTFQ